MLKIYQVQTSKFSATKIKLKLTRAFEIDPYLAAGGNCLHNGLNVLPWTRTTTILVRRGDFSSPMVGEASFSVALRCRITYEGAQQAHDLNVILLRMLIGKAL